MKFKALLKGDSSRYEIKSLISRTNDKFVSDLALFLFALEEISADTADSIIKEVEDISEKNECRSLSSLSVSGEDIKSLGISGKEIGNTLSHLLDEVMKDNIKNEREILLEYAKNNRVTD